MNSVTIALVRDDLYIAYSSHFKDGAGKVLVPIEASDSWPSLLAKLLKHKPVFVTE